MARGGRQSRSGGTDRRGSSYDEAPRSSRGGMSSAADPAILRIVELLFFALIGVVALRLVWIQVIDGPRLAERAETQRTNVAVINAKRGTIYDRNGNVLAMSVDCKTIYCNPKEVTDAPRTARVLASILGGNGSDYLETVTMDTTFVYVERQVDDTAAEDLRQALADEGLTGIYFLPDTKRIYPYGATGGQVLGVVGIDGDGLSGIELYYNDILRGVNGELRMELSRDGDPIAGGKSTIIEAQNGQDIVLSLDIDIQRMAEEMIVEGVRKYEAESGSVMVVDPQNGEILAACSTPLLDLTDPASIVPEALKLRLVSDTYEPGSVFKVITMTTGVENGVITPNTPYSVPAEVRIGDDMVHDDDGRDYTMDMDVREILRRSSNTGTSLVARDLGPDMFANGVAGFGIGTLTGIDYPGEVQGLVRQREDYELSTWPVMSFGQGVAVPMIQMVRGFAAIANSGVPYTPHFLVSVAGQPVDWPAQAPLCTPETAATITDMLRDVMDTGTGAAGDVPGYDIAGKTGTGEQVKEGEAGYSDFYYVSSLVGYANAEDPEVMVYVGLNGTPYLSSDSAAPVFSAIMGEALVDMGVQPVESVPDAETE
ncbi:MAG: penicillin-binding protein 2 [Atopobiaceae bacterium]|nr:penicillin-binding protein 2 [Atopobiaceae bacterium]MBR3384344.1 penicillin-binding protein 2 [Atopobiaceae bacterium]